LQAGGLAGFVAKRLVDEQLDQPRIVPF